MERSQTNANKSPTKHGQVDDIFTRKIWMDRKNNGWPIRQVSKGSQPMRSERFALERNADEQRSDAEACAKDRKEQPIDCDSWATELSIPT